MTIDLLKDLTKLNILDFEFEDLKNMEDSSGYDFPIIKLKGIISNCDKQIRSKDSTNRQETENYKEYSNNQETENNNEYLNNQEKKNINKTIKENCQEKEIYLKIIRKDRIKESIFCYWSILYNELFKGYEESEFTSVINKVRIKETESEEYKHTVLLEIKENKWGILECGSTIHLVKFMKYLNNKSVKKSKLTKEWKKYLEEENEDVLFIGIVN